MAIGLYEQPKSREKLTKFISIARTDTTSNIKAYLPKGAILVGGFVIGAQNSNAGSTATINVGSTSGATDIVNAYDVKSGSQGQKIIGTAIGSKYSTPLTADTPLWCTYVETGTASSQGGPWIVQVEYILVGPNEDLYS